MTSVNLFPFLGQEDITCADAKAKEEVLIHLYDGQEKCCHIR